MNNPFRNHSGANKGPAAPHMMAASHAPVAEPERASAPVAPAPPASTSRGSDGRSGGRVRRGRPVESSARAVTLAPEARAESISIPALPPVHHAPVRIAPIVLVLVQMLLDMMAVAGSFIVAYWLRFEIDIRHRYAEPDVPTYISMLLVTVGTIIITFYLSKLYTLKRGASRVDDFYKIAAAISIGTVLSLATNSVILGDNFVYSRQILLTGWILSIVLVTVLRLLDSFVVGELRKHGVDRARVLVIGAGPTASMVIDRLDRHRTIGYRVVGVVENTHSERSVTSSVRGVPVIGNLEQLQQLVREHIVDEVVVALSGASHKQLSDIIDLIQDESVSVKVYPDAFQLMTQNEVSVAELSGLPLLTIKDVALRGFNRRLKRVFDIIFSMAVLVVTSPLMLLIALGIKLTSPGPVFFIQERVGLDGRPFRLVKFRTMRVGVNGNGVPKLKEGMPGWTVANDPRRTRFGAFLRRFSLDELPQFYNVLVGEMSVVGPRPEQPEYVREFSERIKKYMWRHREKAGITGWAQVNGLRGDSSIEERTRADLYYVENWSLLFDLKIIVRTIVAMLRGKNAY